MLNNIDLEKKINSELNTKVSSSKIVHETLNVSIEKDDLKEVLLFFSLLDFYNNFLKMFYTILAKHIHLK